MRPFQIARMKQASAGGGTFLNSLATTPRFVWSLRKFISSATNAIRVRRSSDNAEMDVGFSGSTVGSGLDSVAMLAWSGSDSVYVKTVYDQTGNGWHHTQTTASKQPRIVNAGSYLGGWEYDGSDDAMSTASVPFGTPQCAIFLKFKKASYASTEIIYEHSSNYNSQTNPDAIVCYADGGGLNAGHANVNIFTPTNTAALKLWSILHDKALSGSSECQAWENSSAATLTSPGQASTTNTDNFGTFDFYTGGRAGTSLYSDQTFETMVGYAADISSLRGSIEAIVT